MLWKFLYNVTAVLPQPLLRLLPSAQTILSSPMASRTLPKDILDNKLARAKGILGESSSDGPNNDWMSLIGDQTPLSRISIPGTHDAAAWNYTGDAHEFWNCQSKPLLQQLDLGIRALDLRFGWAKDGPRLLFYHSVACLDEKAELEDVLWGLFNWLNKHPSETLVISLKRDDKPNDHDERIEQTITNIMDAELTRDYWFQTPNSIPTLGEVRGKIVLLNRMVFNSERGIKLTDGWKSNQRYLEIALNKDKTAFALIEDYFLMQGHTGDAEYQINDKEKATLAHLAKAKEGRPNQLWITFSSAVGDRNENKLENVTPKVMATGRDSILGINKRLIKWCQEHGGLEAGIIFMDFIASDEELINSFLPKKSSSSDANPRPVG